MSLRYSRRELEEDYIGIGAHGVKGNIFGDS